MDPFVDYIKNLHLFLKSAQNSESVHIVMGNESCDLDSTVSALALAYFLHKFKYEGNTIVLPILNIEAHEFPLRTENCYCLKKFDIDMNWLLFRNDIDLKGMQKALKVTLVDHHVVCKGDEFLTDLVVQIFDHRPKDENAKWDKKANVKIEQVGSCATLIAEEILRHEFVLTISLATLLYETINFDTIAFKPEAGKVKALDLKVAEHLEKYLRITRSRNCIFEELWQAHNDVSHLTPKQLLSKDLKVVDSVFIPGLPMLVAQYLKLTGVAEALHEFACEKKASVVVLMGLHAGDVITRDLAFFADRKGSELMGRIMVSLKEMDNLELKVEDVCGAPFIQYFSQGNSKLSRKQILPVIKETVFKNA